MLDLLADWTWRVGRYDLASWNFILCWIGALAALYLMAMVGEDRSLHTPIGIARWVQTTALFLLTAALVFNGSYPVYEEAQPWLPGVLLSGAVAFFILVLSVLHAIGAERQRSAI